MKPRLLMDLLAHKERAVELAQANALWAQEAGARLREARTEAGISARALARAAEVDVAYVSRVERGIQTVSPGTFSNFTEVLVRLIDSSAQERQSRPVRAPTRG